MRSLVVLSLAGFGGSALAADKAGAPALTVKPLSEQDLEAYAGAGCTLAKGEQIFLLDDLTQAVVHVDGKVFELKPSKADANLSHLAKKGDSLQYADPTGAVTAEVVMTTRKALKLTLKKEGKTTSMEKRKLACGD
ncbi:hypothetical protein SAMN05443572_11574 [Myxococcus fulvus]|uniref:Lipoprotein n=1 Tax=Myxococcus fulvus TaxID=33 RepID=A0A511TE95_MYXFU|nr:hypothetical protein [Myxococcus fulvus]GEN11712.1 hypothetical protein MFU01_67490 [Myxococcus fulvus]SEU40302.1 hypothetical protein SAMN05443572_11574 [Myxococcus fulvus]